MAAKTTQKISPKAAKPKLAFYWASSCGGCEITITELGMRLVDVGELVDIVFWPAAMDFKYNDVAALKDKEIDICFITAPSATARTKRSRIYYAKKSKLMIAFGSARIWADSPAWPTCLISRPCWSAF
jgi:F420-non-reducing hydrogenase small subunit